jgi:hypothetical protein
MQIAQPSSFPLEVARDLDAVERQLAGFFIGSEYPKRLLASSRRCNLRQPIARLRVRQRALSAQRSLVDAFGALVAEHHDHASRCAAIASLPAEQQHAIAALIRSVAQIAPPWQDELAGGLDDGLAEDVWEHLATVLAATVWTLPWLDEQRRFLETLEREQLRRAEYLVLTWEGAQVRRETILATLRVATQRPVSARDYLPSVLGCAYTPRTSYLEPREPGHPYLTTLLAYDVQGSWHAGTLHPLMDVPFDVSVAVDVHTVPRGQAMRSAELTFSGTRALTSDASIKDAAAERRMVAAEHLLHELTRQSFHQVRIAVLVSGDSPAELDTHVEEIRARVGSQLSLARVRSAYVQKEAVKFWSQTPTGAIDVPQFKRNMLAHGAGCCLGLLGYHRASGTEGLFWGIDRLRMAPLFIDLFKDNAAAHQIILGQTGAGKTLFLNTMALRAAAEGYQVIGLDAFLNGKRVERAAREGARCYSLGMETPINPLDIVFDASDNDGTPNGDWLIRQVQYVVAQLALLMGTPGVTADNKACFVPRVFGVIERGVLSRAIATVYQESGASPVTPLARMPILSDLIQVLRRSNMEAAQTLAAELIGLLFGTDGDMREPNVVGLAFNAPTAVDWDFTTDICYYDFDRVQDEYKPFYYVLAIGALRRWMKDPARDRRRRTLLQFDEFGYASQVDAVMQMAVEITKTARKYKVGLMLIDQNPVTFLGSAAGRQIFENAAALIAFRLQDVAARQLGEAVSALTPEHLQAIVSAEVGEYTAVIGQDVYLGYNLINDREARFLMGS